MKKQKTMSPIYIRRESAPELGRPLEDAATKDGLKVSAYVKRLLILHLREMKKS